MSQHVFQSENLVVLMGYDRRLDYVFCVVEKPEDSEILYSNLADLNALTDKQDVEYYRPIFKRLGITVPESMFEQVKIDQSNRTGNRMAHHTADGFKEKSDGR